MNESAFVKILKALISVIRCGLTGTEYSGRVASLSPKCYTFVIQLKVSLDFFFFFLVVIINPLFFF